MCVVKSQHPKLTLCKFKAILIALNLRLSWPLINTDISSTCENLVAFFNANSPHRVTNISFQVFQL